MSKKTIYSSMWRGDSIQQNEKKVQAKHKRISYLTITLYVSINNCIAMVVSPFLDPISLKVTINGHLEVEVAGEDAGVGSVLIIFQSVICFNRRIADQVCPVLC